MTENLIHLRPDRLASLHSEAFIGNARWSENAFAEALTDPRCFVVTEGGAVEGFALGRLAADEVELLTLVVAPERRRSGLGRRLLARFEDRAEARGAATAFLEVASDNAAARALYEQSGWRSVGWRDGYYGSSAAVVMHKALAGV